MRRTERRRSLTAFVAASMMLGTGAIAHELEVEDGTLRHSKHALHDLHGDDLEGHIAKDVNYGFELVGHDPLGGPTDGRYTDVWADGRGYAYVGTFETPTCDRSGVWISDISDPTSPTTVGMIKSPPNTRVNDVKTIAIGAKMVLIHTLEPCGSIPGTGTTNGQTGISLWDVTNPAQPHALKQGFMATQRGVHNTFPWRDARTGKTYLIATNDDDTARDTFTVDISKPHSPRLLAEVGLADWPEAELDGQTEMGSFAASFNHDEWVTNVGTEAAPDYRAVISNWDSGFVLLDVNDPANPTFIDDSTYPMPDPVTGFDVPEGNAHAAAFSSDATYIYAGDEDFSASRSSFAITSGDAAGEYPAAEAGFTSPISELPNGELSGTPAFVGLACTSLPAEATAARTGTHIALIERGGCRFDAKATNAIDAGYTAMVVFNSVSGGEGLISMGGDPRDIAGLFVQRSTGLLLAGGEPLTIGALGESMRATVQYDGYGYFHLLDGSSLDELGYYAPGQVNDEDYAHGFGDLTMHNVEGDPTADDVAFVSWYSLGMRAVKVDPNRSVRPVGDDWDASTPGVDDYYAEGLTEIGRWIDPEGSNFWGVTTTVIDGTRYVLGSDRNTGLYLFTFDTAACGDVCQDATTTTSSKKDKRRG